MSARVCCCRHWESQPPGNPSSCTHSGNERDNVFSQSLPKSSASQFCVSITSTNNWLKWFLSTPGDSLIRDVCINKMVNNSASKHVYTAAYLHSPVCSYITKSLGKKLKYKGIHFCIALIHHELIGLFESERQMIL